MNHGCSSPRFLLILVGFMVGMAGCERTTRDTDIKFISVSEAKHLSDRVQRGGGDAGLAVFLDPRPAKYFTQGRIPGARNLTLAKVKTTSKPDPLIERFSNLVVYGDDPASATARGLTKRLIEVGYGNVRFFAGGLEEWQRQGYPVERSPEPAPSGGGSP